MIIECILFCFILLLHSLQFNPAMVKAIGELCETNEAAKHNCYYLIVTQHYPTFYVSRIRIYV